MGDVATSSREGSSAASLTLAGWMLAPYGAVLPPLALAAVVVGAFAVARGKLGAGWRDPSLDRPCFVRGVLLGRPPNRLRSQLGSDGRAGPLPDRRSYSRGRHRGARLTETTETLALPHGLTQRRRRRRHGVTDGRSQPPPRTASRTIGCRPSLQEPRNAEAPKRPEGRSSPARGRLAGESQLAAAPTARIDRNAIRGERRPHPRMSQCAPARIRAARADGEGQGGAPTQDQARP